MRILIVDDEAPTRARLRQMLVAHPDVEVAGEAESGTEAMEGVTRLRPDVVLLDIQMPGSSGIDVAACLPRPRPHVVFCTAYDQYAVEAFELNAVDYLLKPVNRARLAQSLDRVRALAPADGEAGLDRVTHANGTGPLRFLARRGSHYVVVDEAQVQYFGSEGSLTRLTAEKDEFWMDPSLNELERRLDPRRFFRISRAALVNLSAVAQVDAEAGGGGHVTLKSGARLEVSRRRYRELLHWLEGGAAARDR